MDEKNELEKMADRIASLERQVASLQFCVSTLLKIQGASVSSEVRGFHNKIKRLKEEGLQIATTQESLLDAFVVKSD